MRIIALVLTLAAVSAFPRDSSRIIGGLVTDIRQYPEMASLLDRGRHSCGGVIVNVRSILTAAHCVTFNDRVDPPIRWSARLGSSYHNTGGVIYDASSFIVHPQFDKPPMNNDIAIMRVQGPIVFNDYIKPGVFAGADYQVFDFDELWAIGWGRTTITSNFSELLRDVTLLQVNLDVCRQRYGSRGAVITDNMLCAGWLDIGGRDQCFGDSGGPLYHLNRSVVVGICSFGVPNLCADPRFPGVNVRIMSFSSWLINNV